MMKLQILFTFLFCLFVQTSNGASNNGTLVTRFPAFDAAKIPQRVLKALVSPLRITFNPPIAGAPNSLTLNSDGTGTLQPPTRSITWSIKHRCILLCSTKTCCFEFEMTRATESALSLKLIDRDTENCDSLFPRNEFRIDHVATTTVAPVPKIAYGSGMVKKNMTFFDLVKTQMASDTVLSAALPSENTANPANWLTSSTPNTPTNSTSPTTTSINTQMNAGTDKVVSSNTSGSNSATATVNTTPSSSTSTATGSATNTQTNSGASSNPTASGATDSGSKTRNNESPALTRLLDSMAGLDRPDNGPSNPLNDTVMGTINTSNSSTTSNQSTSGTTNGNNETRTTKTPNQLYQAKAGLKTESAPIARGFALQSRISTLFTILFSIILYII